MRFIRHEEIESVYSMKECIEDMKEGFRLYLQKKTETPLRTVLHHPDADAVTLYMPAYIQGLEYETVKVVSIFPNNPQAGLPSLQGIILLTETKQGRHVATLEASGLTIMRTGAAAGVATEYLARQDASTLTILGCGAQARGQLDAVFAVRKMKRVFLWNRSEQNALRFKEEIEERYPDWSGEVLVCQEANEAVAEADILVLSTKSEKALFAAEYLKPGVHINAIGAYRPDMKEFGADTLERASQVWVDTLDGVQHEAGDLIQPVEQGLWSWDKLRGEIAELVTGAKAGREHEQEITLYKSVGIAYMDTIAAASVYEKLKMR